MIFKDKCACGGDLFYVSEDGTIDFEQSSDIYCMRCNKCARSYSIRWDGDDPYPVISKDDEMHKFMENFKK
jgi:hypothetical protein